jgi:protein tyrosine phosphatase (PTP) superfamily phosphohydrolase (DUF442 family)
MPRRTITALVAIVASIAFAVGLTLHQNWDAWFLDHWDVVEHGVLYRSGQLKPQQLREVVQRYGIRTVVSFLRQGEGVDQERSLSRELGVDFLNLPMPGDGFGREEQFREVLAACEDPERRPVLIHCARGTCRTGAAVALYRFEHNGWTVADVAAEMKRQTYQQGWLPGYVYKMVPDRPFDNLYEPRIAFDRNTTRR